MNRILFSFCLSSATALSVLAQDAVVSIKPQEGKQIIPKEIYGQFAEHLGTCIYGGLWVGTESQVPNTDGYRNDMLQALKNLKVPVLRWPGGCFADEYHWRDGIGPRSKRPKMRNNNWGGTIEDNSFGTNEFLNLCEMLGCEPYISGNVGSGTVEGLAKWVEYMTSAGDTPMARLRRENGRDKPWNVKYLGVGNESWGCGGNMTPEYYSDLYRRYSTYCRNYDSNILYRIASGASDYDYNWTKVLMDKVGGRMNGISLHYYTVKGWSGSKGSATEFTPQEYYWTIGKCLEIEDVIKKHEAIMDARDPQKRIGLLVDEWGTWWDEEPRTIRGHLYQQNSMRDAMVAALTLNVFQRHTDRIRMANIAQVANVLQSMILTDTVGNGHLVLTPTYHVFRMYNSFQDATYLPTEVECHTMTCDYNASKRTFPAISASAARNKQGDIIISLANTSIDKQQQVAVDIDGLKGKKRGDLSAEVLTCGSINDYNDFEHPDRVRPSAFDKLKIKDNRITATLPAKSIVVITVR